jgi:4-hydroxy-tetrahydrodipicolinate synthase
VSRVEMMRKLTNDIQQGLLLYTDDGTTLDFIPRGGDGCISVTSNVAANHSTDSMQAARWSCRRLLVSTGVVGVTITFCESNLFRQVGGDASRLVDSAYCRPPLAQLEQQFESQVEEALRQAGLM